MSLSCFRTFLPVHAHRKMSKATQHDGSATPSLTGSNLAGKGTQITVTIEVLSAKNLPLVGYVNPSKRKYYVTLSLEGQNKVVQHTRKAVGTSPEWKQSFVFTTTLDASVSLEVFADRTFHDERIGRLTELIASLGDDERYERKLAPPSDATLRFCVKKTFDTTEGVEQALQHTNADLDFLQAPEPVTLVRSGVNLGASTGAVVQSAVNTWEPLLEKLQIFCETMDGIAAVHPYANMAWNVLSAAYKVFKQQLDRDNKIKALYKSMDSLYMLVYDLKKNMADNKVNIQEEVMVQIAKQTTECCYFIRSYASDSDFVKRMAVNTVSSVDKRVEEYCGTFEKLKQTFDDKLRVETRIVVTRVLNKVQNLGTKIDLNDMPYAGGAALCTRESGSPDENSYMDEAAPHDKVCLPGTRVEVLNRIEDWINTDPSTASRILLLTGAAGTGKSAIAHTIAYRFASLQRLGASFGFNRNEKERTPDMLFPTMARDLADFDPNIASQLGDIIEHNKALRTTTHLETQFTKLIVDPLKALSIVGPIVIVIDALDECADTSDKSRRELLSLLSRKLFELPPNIRVVITSRPEHDIVSQLSGDKVETMSMHNIDPSSTTEDIKLYIRDRLLTNPPVALDGIDEQCCDKLASSSQGLFQWAFVACDTIISAELSGPGVTPRERYEELVVSSSGKSQSDVLDSLYKQVLSHLFAGKDSSLAKFKSVMVLVLASVEPPSLDTLNVLLHKTGNAFDAKTIVGYLGALLSGVTSASEPIRPLHTSFRDFLTDKARSEAFFVDTKAGHCGLALSCLHIMMDGLTFNICQLESSYLLNSEVTDMSDRIKRYIPDHLSYASRFWADHLEECVETRLDEQYIDLVKRLLVEKLLFWFEILSILNSVNVAGPALSFLVKHLPAVYLHPGCNILDCARDACNFVETFGVAISQSAPHVYLSALPFAPSTSIIKDYYGPLFSRTLTVDNPYTHWPAAQNVTYLGSCIRAVAISPDGKSVASVGDGGVIGLWDINTGDTLGQNHEGHDPKCSTNAVAFSADGHFLCTSSDDGTVRVWNLETSEVTVKTFPDDRILSLAFDPTNNSSVVCGGYSGMVTVWDVTTQEEKANWMHNEHSRWTYGSRVVAVAWSHDGTLIASAGEDGKVRLWDAKSGKPVGTPLTGHTNVVTSVAFSPNDERIASGSYDASIRIWDTKTCTQVGEPLVDLEVGRMHPVESVAFSPDGRYLASGSNFMICLWDLGHMEASQKCQVIPGHTDRVSSVAYSHDGTHIVSGSEDGTVRVFDTEVGFSTRWVKRHSATVRCVALSPDDTTIVSSSNDTTLMLWDIASGQHTNTLVGHKKPVAVVAFSPNGQNIASVSEDGIIRIHDAKTHSLLFELNDHAGADGLAFLPNGNLLTSSTDKLMLWDPQTGKLCECQPQQPDDVSYNETLIVPRNGKCFAAGYTVSIRIWDMDSLQIVHTLQQSEDQNQVLIMAISDDGKKLLTESPNKAQIWDTETGELLYGPHDGSFSIWMGCAAFAADNTIISADWYGNIDLWDAESGEVKYSFFCNAGVIRGISVTRDYKRFATGGEDGKVQLWDIDEQHLSGTVLFSRDPAHTLRKLDLVTVDGTLDDIDLRWDGWVKVAIGTDEEKDSEEQAGEETADDQQDAEGREDEEEAPDANDAKSSSAEENESDNKVEPNSEGGKDDTAQDENGDAVEDEEEAAKAEEGDGGGEGEGEGEGEDEEDKESEEAEGEDPEEAEEEPENTRLLFWIPLEQRDTVILPVRKVILGAEPSDLDLSNFVHGPEWTSCYTPHTATYSK